MTRQIFQAIFGVKFTKTTFDKLGIEKGRKLELDGYNSDLRLAFEYNGIYHYKRIFKKQKLEQIQKNDRLKVELCRENSIKLIVIPYFPPDKKIDHWDYIEKILKDYGISKFNYEKKIDLMAIFYKDYKNKIVKIIESHGGKLLSKDVLDSTSVVNVECEQGHTFEITPNKLIQGHWCLHGSNRRPLTEKEIIETVEHYGGKVTSISKGKKGRLVSCICEEGHHFSRETRRLRDGRWCNDKNHKGPTKKEKYTKRSDKYSVNNK